MTWKHSATIARLLPLRIFVRTVNFAALVLTCLSIAGCPKAEETALQTAYAAQGFIQQAQANHLQECQLYPQKNFPCEMINQAVGAQNMLIDAAETYCGWPAGYMPPQGAIPAACSRKPDALSILLAATANLGHIIKDYKLASGGKP
jgi:hypothetical protein